MSLEYTLGLKDKASGPLGAIASAAKRTEGAMGRLGGGGLDALGAGASKAAGGFATFEKHAGQAFSTVSSIVGELAPLALGIAGVAAGVAGFGAKYAADALMFKEDTMLAFDAMLGSSEKAKQVWDFAVAFAAKSPMKTDQVVDLTQKLTVAGFAADELKYVMAGVGDVFSANGTKGAEKAVAFADVLQRVMSTGRMTAEDIKSMGLNSTKLMANLGKGVGVKIDANPSKAATQVAKLFEGGKIGARDAVNAILATVSDQFDAGGPLGGMMAKKGQAMSGLISTLLSKPKELIWSANMGDSLGAGKQGILDLIAALEPASDSGKRLIGVLEKAGTYAGKILGGAADGNGVERTITAVTVAFEGFVDIVGGFGEGFGEGFGAVMKPLVDLLVMTSGDKAEGPSNLTRSFKLLGQVVGGVAGFIVNGAVAIVTIWSGVGTLLSKAFDNIKAVFNPASWSPDWALGWQQSKDAFAAAIAGNPLFGIGASIVDGLWSGITTAWRGMLDKFGSLVELLPASVKDILGIASPSKVFEGIGLYTVQGFEAGLDRGAPELRATANDVMGPMAVTPPTVTLSGLSTGSSGGRGGIVIGDVNVTVAVAPGADAEAIGREVATNVRAQLMHLIDEALLEAGAA